MTSFLAVRRVAALGLVAVMLVLWTGAARAGIEVVTTPAGITVWLQREPSIPIVSLNFAFHGGASLDPEGRDGLANMASGCSTRVLAIWTARPIKIAWMSSP